MPSVPREEIDAMLAGETPPKLAPREEFLADERILLETVHSISYHRNWTII
jgi:hypothetical protein